MLKTLIVSGTATNRGSDGVAYSLTLFGQTNEHPACCYITSIAFVSSGYVDMCFRVQRKYCDYFKTDDFNIIQLDHIIML